VILTNTAFKDCEDPLPEQVGTATLCEQEYNNIPSLNMAYQSYYSIKLYFNNIFHEMTCLNSIL